MFTAPKLPKDAKPVYKGHSITVRHRKQKIFDGSYADFDTVERKSFAQIIPITKDNKIIIVKEEQPRIGEFYGFIGGNQEPGDSLEQTMHKEAREETGMRVHSFRKLYEAQNYGGLGSSACYVTHDFSFPYETAQEAGEKIEMKEITFDELIDIMITDKRRPIEFSYRAMKNYLIHNDKNGLYKILFDR